MSHCLCVLYLSDSSSFFLKRADLASKRIVCLFFFNGKLFCLDYPRLIEYCCYSLPMGGLCKKNLKKKKSYYKVIIFFSVKINSYQKEAAVIIEPSVSCLCKIIPLTEKSRIVLHIDDKTSVLPRIFPWLISALI